MDKENDTYIDKIIDKLYELKSNIDDEELCQCIYTIDNMIKGIIPIDKNIVESIQKKYEKEMKELVVIENSINSIINTNSETNIGNNTFYNLFNIDNKLNENNKNNNTKSQKEPISYYQFLRNIRHSLIRIGVKSSLKSLGINILEKDLVAKNELLYIKLIELLTNKN